MRCSLIAAVVLAVAWPASGQVVDALTDTLKDPTTYVPAAAHQVCTTLDWNSSQKWFRLGYGEMNPAFTVDGRIGGRPISYGAGNAKNWAETATVLAFSVGQNTLAHYTERRLTRRFPDHPRLIHALSWAERIAVMSATIYITTVPHYRAWRRNSQPTP